jgi:hypothetical protein
MAGILKSFVILVLEMGRRRVMLGRYRQWYSSQRQGSLESMCVARSLLRTRPNVALLLPFDVRFSFLNQFEMDV